MVAVQALPEISKAVQDERVQKIRDAIAAKRIDGNRANLPSSGAPEKKGGRRKQARSTEIAGDLFGVSATYVRYAEALQAKDEKLLSRVIVDGERLYALYKSECPEEAKGKGKPGRKPDSIDTTLSKLVKSVEEKREEMPDVFAKLTEAMDALGKVRAAARQAKGDAAKAAKAAKATKRAASASKGKKAKKTATTAKAPDETQGKVEAEKVEAAATPA